MFSLSFVLSLPSCCFYATSHTAAVLSQSLKSSSSLKPLLHVTQKIIKRHLLLCFWPRELSLTVDKLFLLSFLECWFLEGVNHVLYTSAFPIQPGTILVRTGHSGNGRCLSRRDYKEQGGWAGPISERPNVQNS